MNERALSNGMTPENIDAEHAPAVSPEIAARLEALATNAQQVKEGIRTVGSVVEIMKVIKDAELSAPIDDLHGTTNHMMSLSEDGDPNVHMVQLDGVLRALHEISAEEERVHATEAHATAYARVTVDLDAYKSEVPAYILERIANLPRFHTTES